MVRSCQGVSGGLGSAIAEALALEGADVICCHAGDADRADAEKTAAAVTAAGRRAVLTAADVANEEAVAADNFPDSQGGS